MPSSKKTKTTAGTILAIVVALAIFAAQQLGWIEKPDANHTNAPTATQTQNPSQSQAPSQTPLPPDGRHFITDLQLRGATDTPVTASGTIFRVLPDDLEGSKHQRFLVELSDGHRIKISHNIDLAPRVPNPREGETLQFKGDFEANELGGVVHWTHHDPRGRHEPGHLIYAGQKYE